VHVILRGGPERDHVMMYLLEALEWTQCEQQKSHVNFILSLSQVTVSVRMTRSSDQVKAVMSKLLNSKCSVETNRDGTQTSKLQTTKPHSLYKLMSISSNIWCRGCSIS
jgi:hypothetical protein